MTTRLMAPASTGIALSAATSPSRRAARKPGNPFVILSDVLDDGGHDHGRIRRLELLPDGETIVEKLVNKGPLSPDGITLLGNAARACDGAARAARTATDAGAWDQLFACLRQNDDFVGAVVQLYAGVAADLGIDAITPARLQPHLAAIQKGQILNRVFAEYLSFGLPRDVTFPYRLRCPTGCGSSLHSDPGDSDPGDSDPGDSDPGDSDTRDDAAAGRHDSVDPSSAHRRRSRTLPRKLDRRHHPAEPTHSPVQPERVDPSIGDRLDYRIRQLHRNRPVLGALDTAERHRDPDAGQRGGRLGQLLQQHQGHAERPRRRHARIRLRERQRAGDAPPLASSARAAQLPHLPFGQLDFRLMGPAGCFLLPLHGQFRSWPSCP